MNVVDSSGWLEYFAQGANIRFFRAAIEDARSLLVPSICVLEVYKVMARERGQGDALRAIGAMRSGRVVVLDETLAIEAARVGRLHDLPVADSIVLATARRHDATVWTQDAHFEGLDAVRFRAKR